MWLRVSHDFEEEEVSRVLLNVKSIHGSQAKLASSARVV